MSLPRRVPGPDPHPTSPSIPIPDSVEELILLGDGDSDRFLTECALCRAAMRYAREGRVIIVAWAPAGKDFNDILLEDGPEAVARIIDAAEPMTLADVECWAARLRAGLLTPK